MYIDPLPDNKTLAFSKLKAIEGNNFSGAQMVQFSFNRVENIAKKSENAH